VINRRQRPEKRRYWRSGRALPKARRLGRCSQGQPQRQREEFKGLRDQAMAAADWGKWSAGSALRFGHFQIIHINTGTAARAAHRK
jgi:hypothetical protein